MKSNPERLDHPIPSCDVTVEGRRVTVHPHEMDDTVADLVAACELPPRGEWVVDGQLVAADDTLTEAKLRYGSEVAAPVAANRPRVTEPALKEIAIIAGPSCGGWRPLTTGRHCVGRSPSADILLEDATVELHHGMIEVGVDGSITYTQLTGRIASRVDGAPCSATQLVAPGGSLQIGASRLTVRERPADVARSTGGSIVADDRNPWRRVVRRGPRRAERQPIGVIAAPDVPREHRAPPLVGLVGAGVAVGGAGLMALVLGQAMFALFAAIGAVASLATWAVGAVGAHRGRRRAVTLHRRQVDRFTSELDAARADAARRHSAAHRSIVDVVDVADTAAWERRVWDRRTEPLGATLGRGTVRWAAPISDDDRGRMSADLLVAVDRCERLDDVDVPIDLAEGCVVGVHGDVGQARALVRSVVVQLATSHGPADWRLVIVTAHHDDWSWADWLPHGMAGSPVVIAADDVADLVAPTDATTLVVTDAPVLLAARTGPLRRFIDATNAAAVVVTPGELTVPAICDRVLEIGVNGLARWRDRDELGEGCIHLAGISRPTAERAARRLAPLLDPEDETHADVGTSFEVCLGELCSPDGSDIARRWSLAGPDPTLCATVGRSADGTVDIDLVRDGPHGLIAGTTGAGKSELLRTLVVSLAAAVSPDHLTFVLIDFKGGATFDTCACLPHTVGVITDLDEGLAERALVSLDAEVRRRERLLRDVRADDLTVYRRSATEPLPRLVVVVDEFAALAKELPEFLTSLVGIAQRGRSLGLHLLLATQRPAGVVTDDIRANTNLRLALRLHDRADALDVVGDDLPARFPRGMPGRAALRLGPDELVVFQTASCTGPVRPCATQLRVEFPAQHAASHDVESPTELATMVDAIVDAVAIAGVAEPHRPWLDPLPDVLARSQLPADRSVVGLLDDPSHQVRRPLRWDRGNLLVVGSLGSGTTSTAIELAASRLRNGANLYVIDGRSDAQLGRLADVLGCGGVIRSTETERLDRVLRRVTDELDRRGLERSAEPAWVVLIDGLESVRAALSDIDRTDAAARLDRIVKEGPSVGVVTCATTDGSSPGLFAAFSGDRWIMHVDVSTARAAGLGVAPPPAVPGRVVVAASALTGQVVFDGDPLVGLPSRVDGEGPSLVEVLPAVVDLGQLEDGDGLVVGLGADDLMPVALHLPEGDHVFVGGAARTGKTTALRQLEHAWSRRHCDGVVVHVDRWHPLDPSALESGGTTLVVVDDADRIDDTGGLLTAIVAGRHRGVTVLASARVEAVRVAYGHWVREVTRSRCGIIMTSVGEVDGELLGATLPRRSVIAPRPGLAWVIDPRGHRLVQVAARMRT